MLACEAGRKRKRPAPNNGAERRFLHLSYNTPSQISGRANPAYTLAVASDDPDRYVVLRQFRDLPEALAAKSALDSSGIESFIADENTVSLVSSNLGGIRLFVRQSDAEAAAAMLSEGDTQTP